MEILGIGAPELVFIIIIALIVLGPKDMDKAGKTIGKWMRETVTSDGWKLFQQTTRELRGLPNRLMREASDDLNQIGQDLNKAMDITAENRRSSFVQPVGAKPVILPTPAEPQSSAENDTIAATPAALQPSAENNSIAPTPDNSESKPQSDQETNA